MLCSKFGSSIIKKIVLFPSDNFWIEIVSYRRIGMNNLSGCAGFFRYSAVLFLSSSSRNLSFGVGHSGTS